MATTKSDLEHAVSPASDSSDEQDQGLHYAPRGETLDEDATPDDIAGYDAARMKARTALTFAQEKKLLRRIDWHIMPIVSIMFLLKNIDYSNASNARIMNGGTSRNILKQLNMTSNDFNWVSTIYYLPYIIAEAPSNLFIKRLLPSKWLSRIVVSWGLVLACHAAVTNKSGLYVARFFLGLAEAGMFPGVILQMTYWYRPDEMSLRLLYFYMLGNFSSAISGALAYAFDGVSGKGNLSGWQWLFLVEGIFTIVFGAVVYFGLPDFPDKAKWLSPMEKAFVQARLPANAPLASEINFNFKEIVQALRDKKIWLFTLIWAFHTIGTTGLTFYLPTVIANLHFTTLAKSQLLNIPASALTVLTIAIFGVWADSTFSLPRPLYPLFFAITIVACYGAIYSFPNIGGVYAATLISQAAAGAWYPLMWPWRVQTTKQATGSAFVIGFVNSYGQIGGAVGPWLFQSKYAPRYGVSFGIAMGMELACVIMISITWWVTWDTEKTTRLLKKARIAAGKKGDAVLEDVEVDEKR